MAGRIARGDIRLYRFPSPDKDRPVVVLTADTALGYLANATVAAITSTTRGVPSEVLLDEADGMKLHCAVNLHKITTVRQERLGKRVARLSPAKMEKVCEALCFCLGCEC